MHGANEAAGLRRMRFGSAWVALLIALGLAPLGGCRSPAPPPLEGTLRELRRAIERGDARTLHALQTSASRAAQSEEDVRELLELHRDELLELAKRLDGREAIVEARLIYDGDEVGLVYESGAYRLNGAILGSVSLSDPESLVLALRRALIARDLRALLRILTDERRAALLGQLDLLTDETKDRVELDVETLGKSATIRLPSGAVLMLEREDDEWRLHDIRF